MDTLNTLNLSTHNTGACVNPTTWLQSSSSILDSINPANGQKIASVYCATTKDYEEIINQSQQAYDLWRQRPAPLRGDLIREIGNALRERKDALGTLVAQEMGKSKAEGDGEVQEMIDMADFAVGQSRMLYGKTMHSERPQHRMYEQWHPLGVVGVFSAFNFPVAVWAWNAFIAAICGNTVIWKPSPKTPLCAIAVQHICNDVLQQHNLPGIFSLCITDDLTLSQQIVDDERISLISFTGSSVVGRRVGERCARRMAKNLLELSGNNALIIDESADLDLAIPATVFGAIGTAGQRCTTTRRLFIHENLYDEFTTNLITAYQQVTIGDPTDPKNLMGPLIDQDAVIRFQHAVHSAQQQGGQLLFGGHTISDPGFYVEPTIVTAENHWDIVQQETFAPILYVMKFQAIDDAIAMNNNVKQGLSSAIFTDNLQNAELFLSSMGSDCGIANVNIGTSGAEIGGAFGGEKETGGGREAGSDAWQAYMRRQTNTINWGRDLPLAQGIRFGLNGSV